MAMPMMNASGMNVPMGTGAAMNMMMMPRCAMKMEKMPNGMKMTCTCEDDMARRMMQNLCMMMNGNMLGCHMMMNGMMMMSVNMMMGMIKCEMTANGMCVAWTSGDAAMCKMIHCCGDGMMAMMAGGCACVMTMNNTPVCCG